MEFLLISGMLVCGWVFLCVLSGERERRTREIEVQAQIDFQALHAAASAAASGKKPSGSPPQRTAVDRAKN